MIDDSRWRGSWQAIEANGLPISPRTLQMRKIDIKALKRAADQS